MAPPDSGKRRAQTLTLGLLPIAGILGAFIVLTPAIQRDLPGMQLAWWTMVPLFLLAEIIAIHVPVANSVHTFSFREIPIGMALFLLPPNTLLAILIISCACVLFFVMHQPLTKTLFNVVICAIEACAGILVFRAILGQQEPLSGRGFLAGVIAVLFLDLLSEFFVATYLRLTESRFDAKAMRSATLAALAAGLANASVAVLATILIEMAPAALPLLTIILAVIYVAYRNHTAWAARARRAESLHDFVGSIRSTSGIDNTLAQILTGIQEVVNCQQAAIALTATPDHPWRLVELSLSQEAPITWTELDLRSYRPWWHRATLGSSVTTRVAPDGRSGGAMAVPLRGDDVQGVVIIEGRPFPEPRLGRGELRLLESVAGHAAVALQSCLLLDQVRSEAAARSYDAHHDALTGLPNRRSLQRELEILCSTGSGAVFLMDLDDFKDINDTLGHEAGDDVLREIGRRLRQGVSGHVARLGGDEFAVLLSGRISHESAHIRAHAIFDLIRQTPISVRGVNLLVNPSIGIALLPEHGSNAQELLVHADTAMYTAKDTGLGVAIYALDVEGGSHRRLVLASQIDQALTDGQITPWFQPQIRAHDGATIGVEALVRWEHPEYGLVAPPDVLAVVERTGLMRKLTDRMLDLSLRQQQVWAEEGRDLMVAVNATMRDLHDERFPDVLASLLRTTGAPADRLTIEIPESAVMRDPERCIRVLEHLADLGVRISVDDFGTGYSSLSYLERLPLDEVKIDRSFVKRLASDPGKDTVVRATVNLAHALGLVVVAEGVETADVAAALKDLSVDFMQGYYYGFPAPANPDEHEDSAATPRPDGQRVTG